MDDWVDEQARALLDAALPHAARQGWTRELPALAARDAGLSRAEAELALPGGVRDLAALLARRHDAGMLARLAGVDPASLKIRERIARAVEARLEAAIESEAAVRRWMGWLSLPQSLPLAFGLLWRSADVVWRWAGDTATDENHYSKRAILGGILAGALAVRLSGGREAAERWTETRIGEVMRFETWKAQRRPLDGMSALAATLGRMRYGAR